jgi:hypothetical protein
MDSRILEELLPFECEECSYAFERTLAEYFDIGVRCPKCMASVVLDKAEIEQFAQTIAAVCALQDVAVKGKTES